MPRYPAIDNEMDERAAKRRQLAQNMGAQRPAQIHRTDARASINCMNSRGWRNNRDGSRAGQPQGDYKDPDQDMRYFI